MGSLDLDLCNPKWPDEKASLEAEIRSIESSVPSYFEDMWNFMDWLVYLLTFVVLLTHIIDVARTPTSPVCCTLEAGCFTNSSTPLEGFYACAQEGSYVNNGSLTVWVNRIFVVTIFFLWLRLMKYARAFRELGPFIVMVTKLGSDILRFLYLYLEFLIPFSISFWMTFGGLPQIPSMQQVDKLVVSLYRLTLVDDYEYDEMTSFDVVMAYFLIIMFTFLCAVLCLNLFIALLSDTFQRVYDNAKANAVMQQASLLLNFQTVNRRKKFEYFLSRNCNPEEQTYDDDLTTPGDDNLQKVTIQIKEQVDYLIEKLSFGKSKSDQTAHDANVQHSEHFQLFGGLLTGNLDETSTGSKHDPAVRKRMAKISRSLEDVQSSQAAQESSYKKLRGEVQEIKALLTQLMTSQAASINRLNTSIQMTRPLTSPSQFMVRSSDSFEMSSRPGTSHQHQHEYLPGSIPDRNHPTSFDDVTDVLASHQLRTAEVRINVPDSNDVVTNDDDASSIA